jgi:hypothetical protein
VDKHYWLLLEKASISLRAIEELRAPRSVKLKLSAQIGARARPLS